MDDLNRIALGTTWRKVTIESGKKIMSKTRLFLGENLSKKTRKHAFNQESDQESKKRRKKTRPQPRKKEKKLHFFLVESVFSFFFSYFIVFFYKFPPQNILGIYTF